VNESDDKTLALARHYLQIDQPARALAALDRGSGLLDEPDYWRLRAAALLDTDRASDGARAAEQGLRIDPQDVLLLFLHAAAQRRTGDLAAAERSLLRALELDPENASLLAEYATLVARAGQLDKARRLLEEAERLEPLDDRVITARALLAYLSGDDKAVAEHAGELLADDPEAQAGHLWRASALLERGSHHAARRHLETVARLDPANASVIVAAREVRLLTHPLLWPLYPVQRFGPMKVWLGFIVLAGLSFLTRQTIVVAVVVGAYLFLVVYSWVVPPIFRLVMRRRLR
jgi:tetratricopeptide (TPR) repeat protein